VDTASEDEMAEQATETATTVAKAVNGRAATAAAGNGAASGPDWESDANPYKKRFAGEQRAKAQLQQRVTQLEQAVTGNSEVLAVVKRLETRISSVEDLAADLYDNRQTASEGEDGETPREPRSRKVDEVRQRRTQESHVAVVNRAYNLMQRGWVEGMDPNDRRLLRATQLYNDARTDPARTGDLIEAIELFNAVASEARAAAAQPPAAPAGKGSDGTGKKANSARSPAGEAQDDDDETDEDGDGGEPPEPTPRERVAKSGAAAGQGADGRAASPDRQTTTPYERFARSNRGEGYKPPSR
jgi:hypothetical protein